MEPVHKFSRGCNYSLPMGHLKADWAKIMAATCMSFMPGVIFYLFGQRYFIEGIVMTGMKN
jgi:multiple sugar transport system permease protein